MASCEYRLVEAGRWSRTIAEMDNAPTPMSPNMTTDTRIFYDWAFNEWKYTLTAIEEHDFYYQCENQGGPFLQVSIGTDICESTSITGDLGISMGGCSLSISAVWSNSTTNSYGYNAGGPADGRVWHIRAYQQKKHVHWIFRKYKEGVWDSTETGDKGVHALDSFAGQSRFKCP